MMRILRNPKYTLNVTFLEGSALNDHDLRRAHVTTATAIFIMTDKFTADPDQEDARAILQQFSIKRYIAARKLKTRPEFRMQLIRVENLRHLDTEKDDETNANDVVVCLNEIKMVLPLPLPLPLPPGVESDTLTLAPNSLSLAPPSDCQCH